MVHDRLKRIRQADDRFGGTEHEITIALHDIGRTAEHVALGLLIKIQEHIAAEHDVEDAEMREIASRLSARNCTMARISGAICQ